MPDAHVAAAGSGLPSVTFNRRRMLLGLAAASTAAAAPVAAAAAAPSSAENPALLRLSVETPRLVHALVSASAARNAAIKAAMADWPRAPKEIRSKPPGTLGEFERDVEGALLSHDWRVFTAAVMRDRVEYRLRWHAEIPRKGTRPETVAKRKAHTLLRLREAETGLILAEKYEAEKARVSVGYKAADQRMTEAAGLLVDHVAAIMAESPQTMAGILMQGEALEAAHGLPWLMATIRQNRDRTDWASQFAASIRRVASAAA